MSGMATYEKTVSHLTEVSGTLDVKVDGGIDFARGKGQGISLDEF
jgi:hypothetical protein